jgi:hypothetical protein
MWRPRPRTARSSYSALRERGEGESGVGGNDERGAKGQYDDDGKVRKKRHHSNCTIPACTSGAEYIQVALSIVSLKL